MKRYFTQLQNGFVGFVSLTLVAFLCSIQTIQAQNSSRSNSSTRNAVLSAAPAVNLGADRKECENIPFTLNAGAGYVNYIWNTGARTRTISPTQTGLYSVTVSDLVGNVSSDNIAIWIQPRPTPSFFYTGSSLTLEFINGSANVDSYLWDFGDGSFDTDYNVTHTFAGSGTYTVCLTVQTNCHTETICQTITVSGSNKTGQSQASGPDSEEAGATVYPTLSRDGIYHIRIDAGSPSRIGIYNVIGQQVLELPVQNLKSGDDFTFDISREHGGIYFVEIEFPGQNSTRRVQLLK